MDNKYFKNKLQSRNCLSYKLQELDEEIKQQQIIYNFLVDCIKLTNDTALSIAVNLSLQQRYEVYLKIIKYNGVDNNGNK